MNVDCESLFDKSLPLCLFSTEAKSSIETTCRVLAANTVSPDIPIPCRRNLQNVDTKERKFQMMTGRSAQNLPFDTRSANKCSTGSVPQPLLASNESTFDPATMNT